MGSKDHSPRKRVAHDARPRLQGQDPLWSEGEPDDLFDPDRALEEVRAKQEQPEAETADDEDAEVAVLDSEPPPPDGEITGELPVPPLEELSSDGEDGAVPTALDTKIEHVDESSDDPVDAADPRFETSEDPRIPENESTFKIGETARIVGVRPYVLRYWENELDFIQPEKTETGQRRFRREDVATLLQVKRLRHEAGLTMAQTRNLIMEGQASQMVRAEDAAGPAGWMARDADAKSRIRGRLLQMREAVLDLLHAVEGEEDQHG